MTKERILEKILKSNLDLPTPSIYSFDTIFKEDDIKIDSGATKVCIIPRRENFVIKVPLISPDPDYDSSVSPYIFPSYSDYCAREAVLYKEAERLNLHKFFSRTRPIADHIYLQERAHPFAYLYPQNKNYLCSAIPEQVVYLLCQDMDFPCFNATWIGEAIQYYGKGMVQRLFSFLQWFSLEDDLRPCNIGYDYVSGRPVIFDYSGY